MEIKIDGQVIKLTDAQAQQFRTAILNETDVPKPKQWATFTLSCKPNGIKSAYPLVISTSAVVPKEKLPSSMSWGTRYGYDLGKDDVKTFIKTLKAYAKQIWPDEVF